MNTPDFQIDDEHESKSDQLLEEVKRGTRAGQFRMAQLLAAMALVAVVLTLPRIFDLPNEAVLVWAAVFAPWFSLVAAGLVPRARRGLIGIVVFLACSVPLLIFAIYSISKKNNEADVERLLLEVFAGFGCLAMAWLFQGGCMVLVWLIAFRNPRKRAASGVHQRSGTPPGSA